MKILDDISLCCGCHACYSNCPKQAIEMKENNEGFKYPYINQSVCINCDQCKRVCPVLQKRDYPVQKVFACYDKLIERRMESASGGVFALLAEYVLKNDGVVFGAAFDSDFNVEHICVENQEQLSSIKGSKYVQSNIGDQYKVVKEKLQEKQLVLFSGTACQIGGLKSFLKTDYPNLLCVDVVCHGVPSPDVWKKYLFEIKKSKKIINIRFRNKENGIKNAPLKFSFDDGTDLIQNYNDNVFIKGFINNLYLRESCYQCKFKGKNNISDITLGDFWGLDKIRPNFGDNYGISLVMLRTEKGKEIFGKIEESTVKIECKENDAVLENPCINESVERPLNRDLFFQKYNNVGMIKTVKQLTYIPFFKKIKMFLMKTKYNIKYKIYLLWRKVQK